MTTIRTKPCCPKVREGNTGYDIVVPSDTTVKIMVEEGLLEQTEPDQMENFKNVDKRFVNVYWDDGRHYTVPWQFGITSFAVDTAKFSRPDRYVGHHVQSARRAEGARSTCWMT